MTKNFLKLNNFKNEFILFGTPRNLEKVLEWTVHVGNATILPSESVRNINAMTDSAFTMQHHVKHVKMQSVSFSSPSANLHAQTDLTTQSYCELIYS